MNCTQAQDRFSELLDQRHAAPASGDVRTHLASCPNCRKEFAALKRTLSALDALPVLPPSPRLRANFYAMLEEEINSAACARGAERRRQRITTWRWILSPIAACGLLALGFLAGQRHMPGPVTNPLPTANDTQQELAELRQKVDSMSQLVGYSLQQQNSAGQRLQSIFATNTRQAPDQQVIAQLINALALDPSVNVRLAALEILLDADHLEGHDGGLVGNGVFPVSGDDVADQFIPVGHFTHLRKASSFRFQSEIVGQSSA
jgi:hypothetical protein